MRANQDSKRILVEYFLLSTISKTKNIGQYHNNLIFLDVVNTLSFRKCDGVYS